jgi:hypothetical protein
MGILRQFDWKAPRNGVAYGVIFHTTPQPAPMPSPLQLWSPP